MKAFKSSTCGLALACAAIALSLALCARAQTVTFLDQFAGTTSLVQGTDGNLYGPGLGGAYGWGSMIRMTPGGEVTTVYSFCSPTIHCTDGGSPGNPILGNDGNLYGVTEVGGSAASAGTFYKMTLGGKLTVLYAFCPEGHGCVDGSGPRPVIQASDGNFYGVAARGGATGFGTIFRIGPTGQFTLLHSFCVVEGCPDGLEPAYSPIQGSDGNFYGTALGGAGGILYRVTPAGDYNVLYSFCSRRPCTDGDGPNPVVQDAEGNLYGTAADGGLYGGGTVFEFSVAGELTVLHHFFGVEGSFPTIGLTLANDGNFYGDTYLGGVSGLGTLFKITPKGEFTSLYGFAQQGNYPWWGPLLQSTNGDIYGTTLYGPHVNYGTIFSLDNNLGASVKTVPVMGKVGTQVIILGNNLTGSTSVTFNGTAANFTVVSDTEITASVPHGATTGTVSVITPSGALNSNPQFVVTK